MKEVIATAIRDALQTLNLEVGDFTIEHPGESEHGDYATNVAMAAAQAAGVNPRELAEKIVAALEGSIEYVDRIEVAGPGFINFYMTRDFFTTEVARIKECGESWGTNSDWKDKNVIVEYTDPNPFKELHIGHLVPNALGESLARLFMTAGANTKRVTFQGDVGMHVAKAIYGLKQLGHSSEAGFDAAALGAAYAAGATAFEDDESIATEIKALNKMIYERSDEVINELYDYGKEISLQYFEAAYQILGSEFDHNFFESVTGPVGLELVKDNIGTVFTESDGAVIFKGEDHGLHTRVFVNKEGLPTYESKDMGLIKCKHDWQPFDLAITVTGTEQTEYFKVTTKASELVQPDLAGRVELVPNGMLRLSEGKMSSRTGNIVRALALIDDVKAAALERMSERGITNPEAVAEQVAVAAIKYTILRIAAGKDIIFDLKQSVSFEGDSGPYLQYTHARICSVLAKAAEAGVEGDISTAPDSIYEVERALYQYPEVLAAALNDRAPHRLVTYLTELASAFNSFYATEKIADSSDLHAPYKVMVANAVKQTLKNGLWILAIEAPESM